METKHNYGIDFLRILSMIMVVILHILGYGGVVAASSGMQYWMVVLLRISSGCAVNCFAIISGFVSYSENKSIRYSKYVSVWSKVVFYCITIAGVFCVLYPEQRSLGTLLFSITPVLSNQYWYFTAYTGCFFLAPFLNKMVYSCSEKELNRYVCVVLFVFSGYATITSYFGGDIFYLIQGYSFIWITLLYVVGAWLKKNQVANHISCRSLMFIIGSIAITFICRLLLPETISNCVEAYTSPTMLINAIILVALFSKVRICNEHARIISSIGASVFGVYLIHNNTFIRKNLMINSFSWVTRYPTQIIPLIVIGSAIVIFFVCLIVEKVRGIIFEYCGINRAIQYLQHVLVLLYEKMSQIHFLVR